MGSGAAAGEGQQQDDQQQPADDEQGVQGEPPGDSGSHGADNTASICLLTLAISPPELEAVFWREAGTPAYALADRYAYACTILNTVALWLNMRNASNATWLFDACPSAIIAAIRAAHVGPLYVAVASWALAVLLPAQYRVIREPLIIAQRLVRAINTPAFPACTSSAGYGRRIAHELSVHKEITHSIALWMVVKYVSLIGMLWVMQVLLFAFRLRWAAPLQFIAVIAGAISMRSLGCALRGQAACADAARQLCSLLEDISMETLAPLPPWRPGDSRLCREAALEYWVAVVFAFCSLMPLYVVYCRERHHKVQFLLARGSLAQPKDEYLGLRHVCAVVCTIMLSLLAGDVAVSLGWRFDCSY